VINMDRIIFLFLASILAGFALLNVPLTGFFAPFNPVVDLIGILAILIFSLFIIYYGLKALVKK
jgi:hypothetical protein